MSEATGDQADQTDQSASAEQRDAATLGADEGTAVAHTRIDRWWGAVLSTPGRQRAWRWGGPLAVTVLGALLRFIGLGRPHSLAFDETYYVKDAWSIIHLGYEGTWPTAAAGAAVTTDDRFAAGHVNLYSAAAEFVAHPPLGKYLIGLGMELFGPDNSFGWRFTVALLGTLTVFLVAVIARSMFRSTIVGTIAGGLMAIDGQAIVMSRMSLLDGILTFFGVCAFGALLLDRRWTERRLDRWVAARAGAGRGTLWGPALWWRPWLIVMGLACGAATATKWSGMYFLAFFAVYSVLTDMMARRRAGVEFWASSAWLQQGPVSFLLCVPIAAATYVASWTGWFLHGDSWGRNWIAEGGQAWTGVLAWVPHSIQNWWQYQEQIYHFNITLHSTHPYMANPLLWLLMQRPTSMYYTSAAAGQNGCAASQCGTAITDIANPFIWYAAVAAAVALVVMFIRTRTWQHGMLLMAVGAGYLPWLLYVNRTVFQFYTIAFEPYLLIGLAAVIGTVLGPRTAPASRRTPAIIGVAAFLGIAVIASAYWYPMWTAIQLPWGFLRSHYWIPSWI